MTVTLLGKVTVTFSSIPLEGMLVETTYGVGETVGVFVGELVGDGVSVGVKVGVKVGVGVAVGGGIKVSMGRSHPLDKSA